MRFEHPDAQKPFDYVYEERDNTTCSHPGTLAASVAPDKSLHFVVTFQTVPVLYDNYTVFGYTVHGFDVLKHIEYFGHRYTGRPSRSLYMYETGSIFE